MTSANSTPQLPVPVPGSPWPRRLGAAGALVLGTVLLFAAWAKALDPVAFAEQIHDEGLAWVLPARGVAIVAIALEVGLGLALILNLRRLYVLVPTALLVAFFVALTARGYWLWATGQQAPASCGCFGNFLQRTPLEAFWQDLVLLVPPLLLAFLGRPGAQRLVGLRLATAATVTVAMLGLAWKAPDLPLDDLATRVAPGVATADLCVQIGPTPEPSPADPDPQPPVQCLDGLLPQTDEGRHLVVLGWVADQPETPGLVARVDALAAANPSAGVWMLASDGEAADVTLFSFLHGPSFQVRIGPPALLRGMYRQLPRTFQIDDGRVTATWSGIPVPPQAER